MDRLLNVEQLADWLQVKPRTIYQWVHEGYIPVIRLGALIRFNQSSVTGWLKDREARGRSSRRIQFDL